jgi:cytochrome c553
LDGVEVRAHPIMSDEAQKLNNRELKALAVHFASLPCK